jgi:hypothetical protein
MACTTIATLGDTSSGNDIRFGIDGTTMPEDEFGEYIQNLKITAKADKQEIRGSCGTVRAVAFSKKAVDIEYTHYGTPASGENIGAAKASTLPALSIGAFDTAAADFMDGAIGNIYIEEVSTEQSNIDATKTTVKAVGYVLAA